MANRASIIQGMADNKSDAKVAVNRSDDAEKKVKSGSAEVSVPDVSDLKAQERALNNYKITGVVGDYVDPTRDQEWDIAPEFGVAPHVELHNVAPDPEKAGLVGFGQPAPTSGHPLSAVVASKVSPIEDKTERAEEAAKNASDKPEAQLLAEGRPDLRGNAAVYQANEDAAKEAKKSRDKS